MFLGFAVPSEGRILVDDVPLNSFDIRAWRDHIAYLSQRPHMFHASIAENIAMAFDGSPIDMARVEHSALQAQLSDVVEALPARYATIVGERGHGLSGGGVQRIAIARAFYRNAPIVLLDEPTSDLDPEFGLMQIVLIDRPKQLEIARDLSPHERSEFLSAFLTALSQQGARPRINRLKGFGGRG